MQTTPEHDLKIAQLTLASVYPHYVAKVERKGRSVDELHLVLEWLTGLKMSAIQELMEQKVNFEEFFKRAQLNPSAHLIKGVICGYRIEEIQNPLTQKIRYLDKLVDELAKGKKIEHILRNP